MFTGGTISFPVREAAKFIYCWPSCYSVGYTDGHKNPGNSKEFCNGWDDASRADIRTATSTSSSNSECVQLGRDIHNALDQQHFCMGHNDGQNQADGEFKNHIELNDNPVTAQDKRRQYSEGYKIGELNILVHG